MAGVKQQLFLTNDIQKLVGKRIRRIRMDSNLTQQSLAERCELFRTYLSRIENGTANPTLSVLAAIAAVLNVEVAELLEE